MPSTFEGPESEAWIEPFGSYLIEHDAISKRHLERVIGFLPSLDTRLGALAVAKGYISARDVYAVLSAGHDREALFGELAVELGIMRDEQIQELLELQESPFQLFLQALVFSEVLPAPELYEQLEEFAHREGIAFSVSGDADPRSRLSRRDLKWREEYLWKTLDKVKGVAVLPAVVSRVLEVLDDPDSSSSEIASLIETDPALASQLLRVANSALFGQSDEIDSVKRGVQTIGSRGVRQLVLTSAILNKFAEDSLAPARELWCHSLVTAAWSRAIAEKRGLKADAFLPGLLHDLGSFILLQAFKEECAHIEELVAGDATRDQAERQVLGTTSCDIGGYLSRAWSLPDAVGQAALYHSTPTSILRETTELLPSTRAVHAACRIAAALARCAQDETPDLAPHFLDYHELDTAAIAAMRTETEPRIVELLSTFAMGRD